ncbi:XRE family transcriptional regulator [Xenorhabdus griffiniae]|uniref:XRE family transcriptional regulator n=1 Tax=Xenorhabdus griffiniae TaxID=351672 RepID=UPI002359FCD4|nr:XRE family transcriptional regulator [Xenorhabdus griffiniae]MDC9607208.1 S24 family peptidase [Xenorhabdus griffiniae]
MTLNKRLNYLLSQEGLKQKELAERLNTSAQTVNNWLKRNSISRDAAQKISDIYGYSLDWLLNGVEPPKIENRKSHSISNIEIPEEKDWGQIDSWDNNTQLDSDGVEVPFLKDIEFACDNECCVSVDYSGHIRLSKSTLRCVGADSDGSTTLCFPAKGNSMKPVIPDGAIVAIDTANKRIVDGKVYAIEQDGLKRLKILHRKPRGKILIRSYNREEYEDEIADESDVKIIGKMFWYSVIDC